MVRLVEGQVYLKVNFLFLGGGVLSYVSGCWGWGRVAELQVGFWKIA